MNPFEQVRPNDRSVPAKSYKQAGRMIAATTPILSEGDGAPAGQFVGSLGAAPHTNDRGKTFYVRITAVDTETVTGKTAYEFEQVGILYREQSISMVTSREAAVETITNGLVGRIPQNPGFCVGDDLLAVGDVCEARRSLLSPYAFELTPLGSGSGGFWARLISKTYVGTCPVYAYRRVVPDASCADGWADTDQEGETWEVNGVDLPVLDCQGSGAGSGDGTCPSVVVWLRTSSAASGSGGGSGEGSGAGVPLFVMEPRWEFVEATEEEGEDGLTNGVLLRVTDEMTVLSVEEIVFFDINEI